MPFQPFPWTCNFCSSQQIVTESNFHTASTYFSIGQSEHGYSGIRHSAIRCVNPQCKEVTLAISFCSMKYEKGVGGFRPGDVLQEWRLRPESSSKPQPEFIPKPIRDDYFEACLIRDRSPKASATLARRCLQGMIRDFCGISKKRLIDEINEIRRLLDEGMAPVGVSSETIEAIDAIRSIGNIGAHMETDINVIVDVDAGEAQALIELIEMLFEEWYVARNKRQQRLAKVKGIAEEKAAAKKGQSKNSGSDVVG